MRLTGNVGILLPKERYWDIPETEEIKLEILETTDFETRTKEKYRSQEGPQRNLGYQKKPGRRKEPNGRNSTGAMAMEEGPLMISRRDLDTKRRSNTNDSGNWHGLLFWFRVSFDTQYVL